MKHMKRTVHCGALTKADAGKTVTLNGWVHRKRDHGGISFVNLRDRYGITQVVVDSDAPDALKAVVAPSSSTSSASRLRARCAPAGQHGQPRHGHRRHRGRGLAHRNPDALRASALPDRGETDAKEELRLKYRYLDLRSGGMQRRIKLRNDVSFAVREWMRARASTRSRRLPS
jgi:aspartyl-tRNA synthetase